MPGTAKPDPFTHVAIIGPGAVGLCLAVRMAGGPAAPRVTLIDHDVARARRLSARPIRLRSTSGDAEADIPVRLAPDTPADLVILATKAHHARAAASSAAAWIGRAPLVTIQNGLGAGAEVAGALPGTTVVTGVTYLAANLLGEGEVCHVAGAVTHLGYEGRPADGTVERVAALLERSGLPARAEADMVPAEAVAEMKVKHAAKASEAMWVFMVGRPTGW